MGRGWMGAMEHRKLFVSEKDELGRDTIVSRIGQEKGNWITNTQGDATAKVSIGGH